MHVHERTSGVFFFVKWSHYLFCLIHRMCPSDGLKQTEMIFCPQNVTLINYSNPDLLCSKITVGASASPRNSYPATKAAIKICLGQTLNLRVPFPLPPALNKSQARQRKWVPKQVVPLPSCACCLQAVQGPCTSLVLSTPVWVCALVNWKGVNCLKPCRACFPHPDLLGG